MKVMVKDLRIGDMVDLSTCPFVDPEDHPQVEFEFVEVSYINPETPDCTAVALEGVDIVGFPPWHELEVEEPRAGEVKVNNWYECGCGRAWVKPWYCACPDDCPECGAEDIQPYKVEKVEN